MRAALITLTAALALLGGVAAASGSSPRHGSISGIVPHVSGGSAAPFGLSTPIVHLAPSLTFDANYESLINRYFTDVAAASAANALDNVYSTDTQYDEGDSVFIQYNSTFGGSYVSHDPLPANGCSESVDAFCLTNAQLQGEIQNALTANGWHGSPTNMFFLMTPDGVGSCADSSGEICSSNFFCAYHSDFVDASGEDVIYANEPYEGSVGGCTGSGQGFPNDVDADTTINTISHEHNEAITDPLGNAWFADDGNMDENGDLCAFQFGTPAGTAPNGQPFNQIINGNDYSLQEEYSNKDRTSPHIGCVKKLGGTPDPTFTPPHGAPLSGPLVYHFGPVMHTNTTYAIYWLPTAGNTVAPAVTGAAAVNQTLTSSSGSWTAAPTGFSYQWQRCSSTGTGCVDIPGATGSTYTATSADGGNTLRSTVSATNVNGTSAFAPSAVSGVVVPFPAAIAAPSISGPAAVHKKLTARTGSWNSVVTFTYRWQRCTRSGGDCATIARATRATYTAGGADAGHTLRVVVSGTNIVGTASATSAATHQVVAVPASKGAPRISGKAKVGTRLSGSHGSWSGPPTSYRYRWLRCSASGGRCASIRKATHSTYRLTSADAGHRLRVRVTAVDAAGAGTATSRPTASVSP